MRKIIIYFILILSVLNNLAQNRCGTDEYLQLLIQQDPSLIDSINKANEKYLQFKLLNIKLSDGIIYIPVVVHIIHNGEPIGTGKNISNEQVLSQIEILNTDYNTISGSSGLGVVTNIRFCLAKQDQFGNLTTGITRHYSEKEVFKKGIDLGEMDGLLLRKIEELTLYIIEQEKRIKNLEEKIKKK